MSIVLAIRTSRRTIGRFTNYSHTINRRLKERSTRATRGSPTSTAGGRHSASAAGRRRRPVCRSTCCRPWSRRTTAACRSRRSRRGPAGAWEARESCAPRIARRIARRAHRRRVRLVLHVRRVRVGVQQARHRVAKPARVPRAVLARDRRLAARPLPLGLRRRLDALAVGPVVASAGVGGEGLELRERDVVVRAGRHVGQQVGRVAVGVEQPRHPAAEAPRLQRARRLRRVQPPRPPRVRDGERRVVAADAPRRARLELGGDEWLARRLEQLLRRRWSRRRARDADLWEVVGCGCRRRRRRRAIELGGAAAAAHVRCSRLVRRLAVRARADEGRVGR